MSIGIAVPEAGEDPAAIGAKALERACLVETLEAIYVAWAEIRSAHFEAKKRWEQERRRLSVQSSLLLGAVRAAGPTPISEGSELATTLDGFLTEAKGTLVAAQKELEEKALATDRAFELELRKVRAEVCARVARHAGAARPAWKLAVRSVGSSNRILHARRLGPDESVVALYALTGRIPSRYEFLFDDSTDNAASAPPCFYSDEGIGDVRPAASEFSSLLSARSDVWPVKGMIPLLMADGTLTRWVSRGAVLEAEIFEGEGFRHVLTEQEAERMTGQLLAHRLAGKIDLEFVRD